ncbi:MAG: sugar transferase [Maribacter sp.]|nr:sugar transferase [Maribacter sp.]
MYQVIGKRLLDIIIVLSAVIILFPLMLVVAIFIKIFDPGPVFFKQLRTGRNGKEFWFYKFRSMPLNTGNLPSDQIGQMKLTWIGRLIRRTNIDELPQLFNIFKGDMSVVGPRPPVPGQKELIQLRNQNGAIKVRPGLTGLAQINSFDGMSIEEKANNDADYSAEISLINDVKIIFSTFSYLLKPPPVY